MPAYDRYWDLHITAGLSYGFTDEIVSMCVYQRETKQNNNVPGKALLAIPLLSNLELGAAACLNQIATSEVVFNVSRQQFLDAILKIAPLLRRKSVFIDATLTGAVKKLFETKLSSAGFTVSNTVVPANFAGLVLAVSGSGFSLANFPVTPNGEVMTIYAADSDRPDLAPLNVSGATFGYVSTTIPMADIASAKKDSFTGSLVSWILGAGAAKIRITCHGDGEGNLEMMSNGTYNGVSADCIATWLHANGLIDKKNLQVISVNICMGAKHNLTPAVIKNGQYSPAQGSAVELLARTLGNFGVHGVKVTGSNEVISLVEEKDIPNLAPVGTGTLAGGQNVRRIEIPAGFAFDHPTRTLTVPAGWTIQPKQQFQSQLFAIKPPSNWKVDKVASTITRPLQLANADFHFTSPTGTLCTIPSQGWIVDGREVISAEGWTSAGPDKIQFSGTGGVIAIEGQPGPGQIVRIFERIAKSGAKAAVVS